MNYRCYQRKQVFFEQFVQNNLSKIKKRTEDCVQSEKIARKTIPV